jgi:hypothetical protein
MKRRGVPARFPQDRLDDYAGRTGNATEIGRSALIDDASIAFALDRAGFESTMPVLIIGDASRFIERWFDTQGLSIACTRESAPILPANPLAIAIELFDSTRASDACAYRLRDFVGDAGRAVVTIVDRSEYHVPRFEDWRALFERSGFDVATHDVSRRVARAAIAQMLRGILDRANDEYLRDSLRTRLRQLLADIGSGRFAYWIFVLKPRDLRVA